MSHEFSKRVIKQLETICNEMNVDTNFTPYTQNHSKLSTDTFRNKTIKIKD